MRHHAVLLSLHPRSGPQRSAPLRFTKRETDEFLRSLADNPNMTGDFSEKDGVGRTVQVKIVGRYAVIFWADHAVSEVKITHIKPADK